MLDLGQLLKEDKVVAVFPLNWAGKDRIISHIH
jgi:hypothetical protein